MSVLGFLKQVYDKKGVTLTFLSKKTGISVNALSGIFNKKRKITAEEFILIANALELTPQSFSPLFVKKT